VTHNAEDNTESLDEFDYVVVGGGTAGNVVAARLSEDPSVTVCLLEAGPSDVGDDNVLRLDRWMGLLESGYDWDYPVEPQEHGNSFMRHARARVLGGCSSHNSCIAFWAPAEDLDAWAAAGCTGWSAAETFPLYQRLETNDAPGDHHGRSGPVKIRTIKADDPCGSALLEACAQASIPTVSFNTGTTVVRGAGWFQINSDQDNLRQSSSVAYLHPVMGRRPNLEVRTGLRAKRLVIDENRRCTGVEYLDPDLVHTRTVGARRETVVSCGSIDTPKLLMLSGIGPAGHLREVGVDVVLDAPGVGENLQDHPEGVIMWNALQPMVTRSNQWWEIGIFMATEPDLDRPDLMFHYGSMPFDMNTYRWSYPTSENAFCLTPNVTRSRSRGTVRLRTRDFRDKPKVDPRYFTHEHDVRVMTYGLRLAREIAAQSALSGWAGAELAPGPDVRTDDELLDYITKTHNTVYHPSATVKMGADDDATAPLDPRLRVKGIQGLRVADGSAMPDLVTVNPCITTMMIGEKCADMIKADAAERWAP
jgi:choline dehydrogenase